MKKLFILIVSLAGNYASRAQTVGIGTTTPDSKAILDIVSTNKGVLLPRINDTANVTNPVEGLIIYNKNTKTPYYYDGKKWLSMFGTVTGSASSSTDSITYMVTGTGYTTTELPAGAITQGVTNQGIIGGSGNLSKPTFADFNFTKIPDVNSYDFYLGAVQRGPRPASIEFKFYAAGAATPYMSYRLKNIIFTSMKPSVGSVPFIESISFVFDDYSFKDWVTNANFSYNLTTGVFSSY
ncbi:MAG: type VI secretion system tube protein Hcp [Chitinophagaceae bacterium]